MRSCSSPNGSSSLPPAASARLFGSYSVDVFVRQQRDAAAAFTPLVSVDAGMLQPAWAGQRLHWLSGASNQGGGEAGARETRSRASIPAHGTYTDALCEWFFAAGSLAAVRVQPQRPPPPSAAFFRVHSCGQLEYLGTAAHPSPGHLDFPGGTSTAAGRPISPGYVHYVPAEVRPL